MTPLRVAELGKPDALLHIYPRQSEPQDCYLELDTRDGTFRADWNPEIGNAVPSTVYHGMVRRYHIPVLRADTANGLLHELEGLANRVVAGTAVEWNGSNHVAALNDDARDAEANIEHILAGYWDSAETDPDLHWADAGDYLYEDRDELRPRLASGESIEALMAELDGDGTDETTPVLVGLRGYLESLAGESPNDQA